MIIVVEDVDGLYLVTTAEEKPIDLAKEDPQEEVVTYVLTPICNELHINRQTFISLR